MHGIFRLCIHQSYMICLSLVSVLSLHNSFKCKNKTIRCIHIQIKVDYGHFTNSLTTGEKNKYNALKILNFDRQCLYCLGSTFWSGCVNSFGNQLYPNFGKPVPVFLPRINFWTDLSAGMGRGSLLFHLISAAVNFCFE